MFKVSLVNQVRQTPLAKAQCLLPLFEAVMNALQAINDVRAKQPGYAGVIRIDFPGKDNGDVWRPRGLIDTIRKSVSLAARHSVS